MRISPLGFTTHTNGALHGLVLGLIMPRLGSWSNCFQLFLPSGWDEIRSDFGWLVVSSLDVKDEFVCGAWFLREN